MYLYLITYPFCIVAVNENQFYANHYQKMENDIFGMIPEECKKQNCTGANHVCVFKSKVTSCRRECSMTQDPNRGCVSFSIGVEPSRSCIYDSERLRGDLKKK